MSVQTIPRPRVTVAATSRRHPVRSRMLLHAFLLLTAAGWLLPPVWAICTSLRPYADTATRGYVSWPGVLSFQNFVDAWNGANLPHYYLNTLAVVGPALILTLLLSSFAAFDCPLSLPLQPVDPDGLHGG